MSDVTKIAWTRSTFNPWIGCTKVGPGCDHCYAEALDARYKFNGTTHWGTGVPRHRTAPANWRKPLGWNNAAAYERASGQICTSHRDSWHTPGFWPVFCASLADVCDNEAPQAWRDDLWALIEATPNLSWLLVTKRISNVRSMVPEAWMRQGFPAHVRLLITVTDQAEANRDVPKLLNLPCRNGVSYEPALGPVDWRRWMSRELLYVIETNPGIDVYSQHVEWIIIGGESSQGKHKARPFDVDWARSTIAQCREAGVPVFMKQLGSRPVNWCCSIPQGAEPETAHPRGYCDIDEGHEGPPCSNGCLFNSTTAGTNMDDWPAALKVREFPDP